MIQNLKISNLKYKNMTKAILALEDGVWFEGEGFGAEGETFGEVVFNTGLTGYQELLTDPSYKGQMVCMTYPHIGNYGINAADMESSRPWVEGFIIKELSPVVSNYRSEMTLDEYLKKHNILGIQGIEVIDLGQRDAPAGFRWEHVQRIDAGGERAEGSRIAAGGQ